MFNHPATLLCTIQDLINCILSPLLKIELISMCFFSSDFIGTYCSILYRTTRFVSNRKTITFATISIQTIKLMDVRIVYTITNWTVIKTNRWTKTIKIIQKKSNGNIEHGSTTTTITTEEWNCLSHSISVQIWSGTWFVASEIMNEYVFVIYEKRKGERHLARHRSFDA